LYFTEVWKVQHGDCNGPGWVRAVSAITALGDGMLEHSALPVALRTPVDCNVLKYFWPPIGCTSRCTTQARHGVHVRLKLSQIGAPPMIPRKARLHTAWRGGAEEDVLHEPVEAVVALASHDELAVPLEQLQGRVEHALARLVQHRAGAEHEEASRRPPDPGIELITLCMAHRRNRVA